MKQIDNKKLCWYCLGCNRLEDERFIGVKRCKNFVSGVNWKEQIKKKLEGDE